MPAKEAAVRININKLIEAACWRFFPEGGKAANVCLEPKVTLMPQHQDPCTPICQQLIKARSVDVLVAVGAICRTHSDELYFVEVWS